MNNGNKIHPDVNLRHQSELPYLSFLSMHFLSFSIISAKSFETVLDMNTISHIT